MTPATAIETLQRWRESGWLRPLDLAFARFLQELDGEAPPSLLLAAALLAQLEGRGHSCLPLQDLAREAQALLGWPAEAAPELAAALGGCPADGVAARDAWAGCGLVQRAPPVDIGSTPRDVSDGGSTPRDVSDSGSSPRHVSDGGSTPRDVHDGASAPLNVSGGGSSPLVLYGSRLYLRRYWRFETRVAAEVLARSRGDEGAAGADVDRAAARALLNRLFAPAPAPAPATGAGAAAVPDWQKLACALALRARLTLITGGPGTGKTYTAARLLVLLQALHKGPQPLRVALAAPTGKAAARLRQSIVTSLQGLALAWGDASPLGAGAAQPGPARTLHALLGTRPGTRRFVHDAANPLDIDLLFVDEASMVHLEMMAALLQALPSAARVILLGDKDQLASVEAGSVMAELCQGAISGHFRPETARWLLDLTGQELPAADVGAGSDLAQQALVLRHSHRFAGAIGKLAVAVNRGDGAAALALLRAAPGGEVTLIEASDAGAVPPLAADGRAAAPGGYRAYLQALAQRPADAAGYDDWARLVLGQFDRFRVLCAVREGPWGVAGLNAAIERALAQNGLLQRRGEWYEGRPVMVTRNDASLGVFNGDIGIVLRPPGASGSLRAWFLDGEQLRSVSVGRLADVETAFAMTVHKSQGSEFEHVLLVLPEDDSPVLTRELVYTGITRARSAFTLVCKQPAALATAVGRQTRRISGLADMLGN